VISGPNSSTWHFDETFVQWQKVDSLPQETCNDGITICLSPNGIFVAGGWHGGTVATCFLFNNKTNQWIQQASMPTARTKAASVCIGNTLLIIGGWTGNQCLDTVEYLDTDTGIWHIGKNMLQKLIFPITTKVANMVYVVFSTFSNNKSQRVNNNISLQCYDVTTNKWKFLAPLPLQITDTDGASAVGAHNQLYVIGGIARLCSTYNPVLDTWTILQSTALEHSYGAAVFLKGKIMVLGGSTSDQIEEYDLQKGEWELSSIRLPSKMQYHHAIVL
jgi:N-acetylneuraminic acid mutarotase